MIKPTVGRVVWYTPPHAPAGEPANDPQTHAALIAYVWHDRMVNLAVFSPNGENYGVTSVTLVQEGDMAPEAGRYAEWMTYQVGQAKKHSAEDAVNEATRDALTGGVGFLLVDREGKAHRVPRSDVLDLVKGHTLYDVIEGATA
ncbi:hypothetical protein GJ654_10335 [Rhodoblastus acidophilus]|uniref:Uncharacterized protein n=1 Tax=Rhodoblastus acidophilus TaxID=1074 RepID=A0A6N8DQD2_RHOAC|nr:hypothetical protein [Rhodoblastus acidophilus]MCW2275122.1 hypothetical protein [Rhodoblastus acidophilus]MTV31391.1 hypothetical protein [Rhodoblastus acidophilus]